MDGMKCANEPCSCPVDLGEDFCSDHCRRAAPAHAEIAHGRCGCRHTTCAAGA